jgi:hypothetical protein
MSWIGIAFGKWLAAAPAFVERDNSARDPTMRVHWREHRPGDQHPDRVRRGRPPRWLPHPLPGGGRRHPAHHRPAARAGHHRGPWPAFRPKSLKRLIILASFCQDILISSICQLLQSLDRRRASSKARMAEFPRDSARRSWRSIASNCFVSCDRIVANLEGPCGSRSQTSPRLPLTCLAPWPAGGGL